MKINKTDYKLNDVEARKVLIDIIKTIENTPNNMELGEIFRKKYWEELKALKENL